MHNGCRDCRADLDHCHGALIEHARYRSECTTDGCVDHDPARHAVRLGCAAVDCGCALVPL